MYTQNAYFAQETNQNLFRDTTHSMRVAGSLFQHVLTHLNSALTTPEKKSAFVRLAPPPKYNSMDATSVSSYSASPSSARNGQMLIRPIPIYASV
jgi:hypothetical protein